MYEGSDQTLDGADISIAWAKPIMAVALRRGCAGNSGSHCSAHSAFADPGNVGAVYSVFPGRAVCCVVWTGWGGGARDSSGSDCGDGVVDGAEVGLRAAFGK